MRAYLIDPKTETVEQVDYDGNYRSIYKLLGIGNNPFTVVRLGPDRDVVFVDDEGLLNDPRYFFFVSGYHHPLAGRGLVLGTDADGDSISPAMTLDELRARVTFTKVSVEGFVELEAEEDTALGRMRVFRSMPVFGPGRMRVFRSTPVFGPPRK
jgi:hypothetical protein